MDQLKDILKQAVKYRFWIALSLSALLPLIGYFVGSGPIKEKALAETKKIEESAKKVANYTQPNIPNAQYPPILKTKTEIVGQDVTKAWEKLYAVQAPLLKWPERVEDRFHTWGRKWPENVDKGAVQQAISDYVLEYDKAVESTYAMVIPWEPITGNGIVVVPDKTLLLRPAVFDAANPPELGKVWAAQERLWIQGTLLAAVAKINGNAKSWDSAIVKQINEMEVGSPSAQDQRSLAKGDTVEPAASLTPGGAEAAVQPAASSNPMAEMMAAHGGAGGGSGAASSSSEVYHIKTDSQQYTIMPVKLVAMVDQNRLQDFLIGLENSPMSIQVMEFELVKPSSPVMKPLKGESPMGMGMGMGMGSGSSAYPGMEGGMANQQAMMTRGAGMPSSYPSGGGMANQQAMMGMGGMSGMYGGATAKTKTGVDNRAKDPKKDRESKEKARRERARATDMYYDVVEVTVYGQARFYNPPPAAPTPEASTSVDPVKAAPVEDPGKPTADPAKPADAPKIDPVQPTETAKTVDPAKPDEALVKSAEAPKGADVPKAATPEKPPETSKPVTPKS